MRAPRFRSLRARLAAWYAAVLAVTLLAFAASVYFIVDEDEDEPPPPHAATSVEVEEPEHVGQRLIVALAVALPGALALAIGGGLWITRRTLRPLDEVARLAAELGAEQLDRRVELPEDAATELRQLADSFNSMLARLDRSVAGMRRFTADASHELRTPLAVLRGELEVTLRRPRSVDELCRAFETALGEVERLSELVDALLTLARSDAGELPLNHEPLDLVELVRRVLSPYEAVAADRQLALELRAPRSVRLMGDDIWIGRVVANLVDNACKFTPSGGCVKVEVGGGDGAARVVVRDNGPGYAAADPERLFERFYRGPYTQGQIEGFGLGLALARDVVRAMGGTLTAELPATGGASFTISLPAALPSPRS